MFSRAPDQGFVANRVLVIVALLSVSIYGGWTFVITTALAAGCLYKPVRHSLLI